MRREGFRNPSQGKNSVKESGTPQDKRGRVTKGPFKNLQQEFTTIHVRISKLTNKLAQLLFNLSIPRL